MLERDQSYLFGANTVFIEELYKLFKENPEEVDKSWHPIFNQIAEDNIQLGPSWSPQSNRVIGAKIEENLGLKEESGKPLSEKSAHDSIMALMLIRSYRVRGHLLANLDPLGITERELHPDLDPVTYGFTESDYDHPIYLGGSLGLDYANLRDILKILKATYCQNIGVEFMHIPQLEQREWIEEKFESNRGDFSFSKEEKKRIYQDIMEVEGFENFLHVKYPGSKRFSVEGGETAIAAMEAVIEKAASFGAIEMILGMAHRGRLNVLTKVMGKSYTAVLHEFQGGLAHPEEMDISGDVKYHLGTSTDRDFDGHKMHLSLTPNPSHLEAVNPVVVGKVRCKQDIEKDIGRDKVWGMLLHGDAAFAGQGIVPETLMLGDLKGYTTGGTIHVIINNQIGFTTNPKNARISPYPSDIAKGVHAPIFHVNGDDPEAVVHVSRIAADFRQKFNKDVVLDIVCYRRYGHNEGDEPFFTQPVMYSKIKSHPVIPILYGMKLTQEGSVTEAELEEWQDTFRKRLDKAKEEAEGYRATEADWLSGHWKGIVHPERGLKPKVKTGIDLKTLKTIGKGLVNIPEQHAIHPKLKRQLEAKSEMFKSGKGFDWATAEALAFGSLLLENHNIRFTGQDVVRGTFSHRHAGLNNQTTGERYYPLKHLSDKQGNLEIIDSNLSEFAVLGFEYGYSMANPNNLVLWEAQFGDFSNGAQVMIDQFIASSEIKWMRLSGLVMLLPHGYEGQGPEHSSARLERYLQLCAEDNMQVVNCSTPASYFHVLRRQLKRDFRKPLIIMTPKSLLRHKVAVSNIEEFTTGTYFMPLIGETEKLEKDDKIKRVVICSGKLYYDLLAQRTESKVKDVAILRMEQYHPFPDINLENECKRYKQAEFVWCQEEPKNMGAWSFVAPFIEESLEKIGAKNPRPVYVGRDAAASPAVGYLKIHNQKQAALVRKALAIKE